MSVRYVVGHFENPGQRTHPGKAVRERVLELLGALPRPRRIPGFPLPCLPWTNSTCNPQNCQAHPTLQSGRHGSVHQKAPHSRTQVQHLRLDFGHVRVFQVLMIPEAAR